MGASLNKVSIIGNLGKDPEVRTTPSGKKVANFSVCTSDRWTDKEGKKQESAQWHRASLISDRVLQVPSSIKLFILSF